MSCIPEGFDKLSVRRFKRMGVSFCVCLLVPIFAASGAAAAGAVHITEIMYNPTGGTVFEFVELFNAGDDPADLSGAHWNGIEFIFPANSVMQPGEVWLLASDENPQSFATEYPNANPIGYFARNLANGGERVTLLSASGETIASVSYDDEGAWPEEADGEGYSLERTSLLLDPDDPAAWKASGALKGSPGLFISAPPATSVRFHEIAAALSPGIADNAPAPDWIELANHGGSFVDLSGWSLTDRPEDPSRYRFPQGSRIEAGGLLLIGMGEDSIGSGLSAPFALSRNGESLFLFNEEGIVEDFVRFGRQSERHTLAVYQNAWTAALPTPGEPNAPADGAEPMSVRINEWLADSPPDESDWLELFNASDSKPVFIEGLELAYGGLKQVPGAAASPIRMKSEWKLFKGFQNPSQEPLAWTRRDFDDSDWTAGQAPFTYGQDAGQGSGLDDMRGGYTSLFLRKTFVIENEDALETARLKAGVDDGFIIWINGFEWGRLNIAGGLSGPNLTANTEEPETAAVRTFEFPDFKLYFNNGENVIAVQALNASLDSPDFYFDLELETELPPREEFVIDRAQTLTDLTVLDAGQFLQLIADNPPGFDRLEFNLPAEGGSLLLLDRAGNPLQRVDYPAQSEGMTQGFIPDGSDDFRFLFHGPTPGASNVHDRDADGIPNEWEEEYGLNPDDPSDAHADRDGDGASNLEEYRAGTSPLDAGSRFGVQITRIDNSEITLSFPTEPGKSYTLLKRSLALEEPFEWTPLLDVPVSAAPAFASVTDAFEPDAASKLYQVVSPRIFSEPGETVQERQPPDQSVNVPLDAEISIQFAADLDPNSLPARPFVLRDDFGREIEGEYRFVDNFRSIRFQPSALLAHNAQYEATLNPDLRTMHGNPVGETSWRFNTSAPPDLIEDRSIYERDGDGVLALHVEVFEGESPYTLEEVHGDRLSNDDFEPWVRVRVEGEEFAPMEPGSNAVLKLRGQTSRNPDQKSYNIELDDSETTWRGHERLLLNKHPYELTRVRNRLSFELFESIPHMTSLRMQYVQLFINGVDKGLYSQIERYDERFLERHGLDPDGHLYKANRFEWNRYADVLKDDESPDYVKSEFEYRLEIQTRDDHAELLRMLDDLNDLSLDFDEVFDRYFHRENYLTWLASVILMGNKDTNAQNFMLYSPSESSAWYLLPWDYDGAWGFYRQPDNSILPLPRWTEGIANWWNNVLHRRFIQNPENLADLTAHIQMLRERHVNAQKAEEITQRYQALVRGFISTEPDSEDLPSSFEARQNGLEVEEFDAEFQRIVQEPAIHLEEYLNTLERPMPVFMGTPAILPDRILFAWSESFDLQGDAIYYDFQLSKTPDFGPESIFVERTEIKENTLELPNEFEPGVYFWRILIRDRKNPKTNWQIGFDFYVDPESGEPFYGVKPFTVP